VVSSAFRIASSTVLFLLFSCSGTPPKPAAVQAADNLKSPERKALRAPAQKLKATARRPAGPRKPPPVRTAAGSETDDPVLDRKLREEQRREGLKLLEAFPQSDDALFLVGLILDEQGDTQEALKLWRRAFELDRTRFDAAERIGSVYQRRGKYSEAEKYYQKALELKPDFVKAREGLAQALLNQGKAAEAVKLLQGRAQLPGEWRLLGQAYQELGRLKEAKEAYLNAVALKPRFTEVYYGLARVCARLGQKEETRKYQKKFREYAAFAQRAGRQVRSAWNPLAITKVSCAHSLTDIGRVYAAFGQFSEAERVWRRACEVNRKNVSCRLRLALLCQRQGRLREALKFYEEVVRIVPESGLYRLNVGNLCARLGEIGKAEAAYKKVIELEPKRSEGYFALAQLYLNTGRSLDQALTLAQKAVELAPIGRNYAVLARALAVGGKVREALEAIGEALRLEPGNPVFLRIKNEIEGKL